MKITDAQAKILVEELVPMIVADITPLLQKVLEKRLQLFALEVIKNFKQEEPK